MESGMTVGIRTRNRATNQAIENIAKGLDPTAPASTGAAQPTVLHPEVESLNPQQRTKYDAVGGHPTNPTDQDLDYIKLLKGAR
jgi:hypothetical protein